MYKKKNIVVLVALSFIGSLLTSMTLPLAAYASSANYQASDVLGQEDTNNNPIFNTNSPNNGSGSTNAKGLYDPYSTAIDTVHHRLYVVDAGACRVVIYNLDSSNNLVDHTADYVIGAPNLTTPGNCNVGQNSLNYPTSATVDQVHDRLFINTDKSVLVFDFANGITNGMDASYVLGQPDFTSTTCLHTQNSLCNTDYNGLTSDAIHDRLFVMDNYDRIMVFNVSPGSISNGENADYVLGQPDFTTTCNVASQSCLAGIEYDGIAYDEVHDRLFITNEAADRVLIYNLSQGITNGMNASYVLGQPNFSSTSADNPPSQNNFGEMYGSVAYNPVTQQLYVDDSYVNLRVLVFDLSGGISNDMNASAVLGATNFASVGTGGTTSSSLIYSYSNGIAIDPTNNRLYFPDASNNRVLIYNFVSMTNNSSLAAGAIGSTYSQTLTTRSAQGTVTYAVTGGGLPPGLNLNATSGQITGTPSTAGTYTFELTAYDNNGAVGTFVDDPSYSIVVSAASGITNQGVSAPNTGYGQPSNNSTGSTLILISSLVMLTSGVVFFRKTYRRN